ncbi:MAG TPA: 4Fe-4S ferredoxin, partial [Thermoanaerobacterium sp.]|nr:4Fe-4S ferredoxin [Thermoanaerobacterium sp.]
ASYDLVNQQVGFKDSVLERNFEEGADKFRGVWSGVDSGYQLVYAEDIGLGSREYRLIKV